LYYSFEFSDLPNIFLIGQSICKSNWKLKPRIINDYEIIFVYKGEATFYIEEKEYHMYPGEVIVIPPNKLHSAETYSNNSCRFYYVHFYPNMKMIELNNQQVNEEILLIKDLLVENSQRVFFKLPDINYKKIIMHPKITLGKYEDEIFTIIEKALYERNHLSVNSKFLISLYISEIFVILTRISLESFKFNIKLSSEGELNRFVQDAIIFIENNLSNPLSVNEISKHMDITPQYLIRLFNQKLGQSPIQYINHLRIEKSKYLIRTTSLTFKEICYSIGMENPHYFSRLFKKLEGITPSDFKKRMDIKSN